MIQRVEPAFIPLAVGATVRAKGSRYKITHILNEKSVLAVCVETSEKAALNADEIRADVPGETHEIVSRADDLDDISEQEWQKAKRRFDIIKPLLDDPHRTAEAVRRVAEQAGVHLTTVYEWLKLYTDAGHLSALIPQKRGPKFGSKRTTAEVEAIIDASITNVFLNKQRPRVNAVVQDVLIACRNANLEPPHANTIRKRIAAIPAKAVLRRRGLAEKARNQFEPVQSSFPNAEYPLAVVQVDHTELDVIVVETQTRKPMGRPWITVAIDVYSRMILGLYISMDRPSSVAVGMCLSRAMLPKTEYMEHLGVPGEWKVWGKMRKIYVDNAKEFRGNMLKMACDEYGIDLEMRPVKTPHYGGHIERYMGTTSNEMRKLPGATFSSPSERKGYDSDKEAALTLHELEQHVVDFVVNVYHKRIHSELRVSPSRKWQLGILGDSYRPGIGIPPIPANPLKLSLDFMPFEKRSVQTYGIVLDNINYYHEVLNGWINAPDPNDPKNKRQFLIRRDPRDISVVFFFDPDTRQYYPIPYRNTTFPPISLWELKAVQQRLKQEGRSDVDENGIFDAVARMRERVEAAIHKTRAARRQSHRTQAVRKLPTAKVRPSSSTKAPGPTECGSEPFEEIDIFNQPIEPFEDLQVKPWSF